MIEYFVGVQKKEMPSMLKAGLESITGKSVDGKIYIIDFDHRIGACNKGDANIFTEYIGKNLHIINALNNDELNVVLENALSDQTGYVKISNFSKDLELKPEIIDTLIKYDIRLDVRTIGDGKFTKIGRDYQVFNGSWDGKVEKIV
jgi:hypothetical protein